MTGTCTPSSSHRSGRDAPTAHSVRGGRPAPDQVREARPDEDAAVAALVRGVYRTFAGGLPPALLRSWVDEVVAPHRGTTLVAHVDGQLAGTARLHLPGTYPVPLPAGSAGVRAVAVAPAHRRIGVARALMAACAERGRTAGATALHLHTAPFMPAAVALYEGLGYRRDPSWDFDVGTHFGIEQGRTVATAYRYDLAPACRVLRNGAGYRGKQGLDYAAGVSAESVGARGLCLHPLTIPPGARAKAHRHEAHESAIYTISGTCEFWWGPGLAHHEEVGPGDVVYIPAGVPHLPINNGAEPVMCVVARTDPNEQESVILMPELDDVPDRRAS
jgi:uncharacterized RmlC-like cupin family protein/GNAT superfamily N-acetyltransferase